MSAYSASAPVTASTTPPSARNAVRPSWARNLAAYVGDSARRTLGWAAMPWTPSAARTMNQTSITGPNSQPTVPVPRRCSANNPIRIAAAIGTTRLSSDGCTISTPSTADRTEIAGVIIESPKNSEAPKIPSATSPDSHAAPEPLTRPSSRAISAMMPPSPSLSERITKTTYCTVTMITTAQNTSETTPNTEVGSTGTGRVALRLYTACRVYSGLVPMSPKTTPSAPIARAVCRSCLTSAIPRDTNRAYRTYARRRTAGRLIRSSRLGVCRGFRVLSCCWSRDRRVLTTLWSGFRCVVDRLRDGRCRALRGG